MVVASDACGNKDTSTVTQQKLNLTKSIAVTRKCVGLNGVNGSGDVLIKTNMDNGISAEPELIKKDGVTIDVNHSAQTNTGNTYSYIFPNLSKGTYIVKYILTCGQSAVYDTFDVVDYAYPNQFPAVVKQCGNSPFTFKDSVVGGLAPFMYEIIGSTPTGLVRPPQSNPNFTIVDSTYDVFQVRAVDVCGNSSMSTFAVDRINGCYALEVDSQGKKTSIKIRDVKVYPNPSNGKFTISFSQKKRSDYKVEITNALGVKMYNRVLFDVDKKDHIVNEHFSPGFYIIAIYDLNTGQYINFKQVMM